jgi:hypothetical protein
MDVATASFFVWEKLLSTMKTSGFSADQSQFKLNILDWNCNVSYITCSMQQYIYLLVPQILIYWTVYAKIHKNLQNSWKSCSVKCEQRAPYIRQAEGVTCWKASGTLFQFVHVAMPGQLSHCLMAHTNNKHNPVMLLRGHTWIQRELQSQTCRVSSHNQEHECMVGELEYHQGRTPAKKGLCSYWKKVSSSILKCQSSACLRSRGCDFIVMCSYG